MMAAGRVAGSIVGARHAPLPSVKLRVADGRGGACQGGLLWIAIPQPPRWFWSPRSRSFAPSPSPLRRKPLRPRRQRATFRVWSILAVDRSTWSAAARAAPRRSWDPAPAAGPTAGGAVWSGPRGAGRRLEARCGGARGHADDGPARLFGLHPRLCL